MTTLIDGLISIGLGSYMTLLGFGVLPRKSSEKKKQFVAKWGSYFAVGGILVGAIGCIFAIEGIYRMMT